MSGGSGRRGDRGEGEAEHGDERHEARAGASTTEVVQDEPVTQTGTAAGVSRCTSPSSGTGARFCWTLAITAIEIVATT